MSFVSLNFIAFFAVAITVFYLLPKPVKKYWVLASSYYFYASADVKLLAVLIAITALTYIGGLCIANSRTGKKLCYVGFFAADIGILIAFKYIPFLAETANTMFFYLKMPVHFEMPAFFVPLGISFIIFQSATYLGDIYKGEMIPASVTDHALFLSFFPTLLSGPIQKAGKLIPQLGFQKEVTQDMVRSGLLLIAYGFIEKFYVANNLKIITDRVFNDYSNYGGPAYLIAGICFSIQIYADFSAYSDIARGVSRLMGVDITKNFNNPYLSASLADFWNNWHISLNSWLKEYVYIPLGGNRKGRCRKYLNTMIVFLCSGFWHGASWHFVIWGLANGALQICGQITKQGRFGLAKKMGILGKSVLMLWMQRTIVFLVLTATWIFFRVPSVTGSLHVIKEMYSVSSLLSGSWNIFNSSKVTAVYLFLSAVAILFFAILQNARREEGKLYRFYMRTTPLCKMAVSAVIIAILTVYFCHTLIKPDTAFIYFQF